MFGGPVWAGIASGITIAAQIGARLGERKLSAAAGPTAKSPSSMTSRSGLVRDVGL
jgi:hypothetical protein